MLKKYYEEIVRMYETYIQTWKQYAEQYGDQTCLFYMVGKFYEMYDILDKTTGEGQTNVKQAVEALGITLTTREKDGPNGEDCYFAGFPEQSLQKFAGMLTREGWTVVVCDQEKNEAGRVTKRPVARIFSPGTHIELAGAEAPYLAGLWFEEIPEGPPRFSAAVLDMTTGHLASFESVCHGGSEIWSADELVHFFQIHSPRETVIWWRGASVARPMEAIFRRRCGLPKGSVHLESGLPETQGTLENALVRKSFLEKIFSNRLGLLPVLEQLRLRGKPLTERVLVSLLRFAEDHLPSAIQQLQEHTIWSPETSVYMGNNTLAQLNYVTSGTEQSVLGLFNRCLTSLGKRGLKERLLSPSSEKTTIEGRLAMVDYFMNASPETIKRVEGHLRMIHDIARIHRKIGMYTVTASDILALDTTYGCVAMLDSVLQDTVFDWGIAVRVAFQQYKQLFESCFDIEKAKQAIKEEDISFLPKSKAPRTTEVEEKLLTMKQKVEEILEKIRVWVGLPPDSIRIEKLDTASYVFTATKTSLAFIKRKLSSPVEEHPVPGITLHEKKSSRGTISFPLLETFHFQTFHLRNQLQQAIKEELPPICQEVQHPMWKTMENWLTMIDVSLTLAKIAKERGYVRPELCEGEEAGIYALGMRHPLLESIQTKVEYVKHDVSLGFEKETGWLLYGMNASGKSSLMKSIGVNVLLAQAGSYVPASVFKLKPFKSILTRILNQDSIWAGLSSFAVEISELRDIFQKADKQSLVLGDELCSGTESVSATSLVAAGIQFLHAKHSRFVFATHLHDLNKLPDINSLPRLGIWHLRVHYDAGLDRLIYDRTLHRGPGGTLYGLEVARAMHLPYEILKQAQAYRRSLLGEVALEEADTSSWNSQVIRQACEVCQHPIARELEVHHITPRASATNGRLSDGTSMNRLSNLVVVCQGCHDKHHAGEIQIGPKQQTSNGPQRITTSTVSGATTATKKKVKWSEEELKTIEGYLRRFPHLSITRLVYDLKQQEDIEITSASLTKIRNSLS
jgi:DNA mismatch repair protein MutS